MNSLPMKRFRTLATVLLMGLALPVGAIAQSVGFMQGVAEAAGQDRQVVAFYKASDYQPLWTAKGRLGKSRRQALYQALSSAPDHGLPSYDTSLLTANLRSIRSDRDLGRYEVALTRLFLAYAQDVQSGILSPSAVNGEIARKNPVRDQAQMLDAFSKSTPEAFIRSLPPQTTQYAQLMRHKLRMEQVVSSGGWGPRVPDGRYEIGDQGGNVVALRNRLIAMGYLGRTSSAVFDKDMQRAVHDFQVDHGLLADGIAGEGTIREINRSASERLGQILASMERERWMNFPLGERHIWVNIPDFSAAIIDNGRISFQTRAVVGANTSDRRTPEFSDQMEHMVLNPSWYVPRSITVKEYLPLLQENPNAVRNLNLIGVNGEVLSRNGIDFNAFDATTFPFSLREPPSQGNALGLVKFMFPNRFNIYLHDTPAKNLFSRERRAYSHGCIRLADPFDFAYALLARQTSNPEGYFHSVLNTGKEATVPLERHVPVHIVYRTAFTNDRGDLNFRRDVYGRDAMIFDALIRAGVAIPGLRS